MPSSTVVNSPISHHCVEVVTIGRDASQNDQALDVIVEIGSDARRVDPDRDPDLPQVLGRPNSGEHQQFRRVDGAGGDDDLAPRRDGVVPGQVGPLIAHTGGVGERTRRTGSRRPRTRAHLEVLPGVEDRMQVGVGGRHAGAVLPALI